jgi:hypothetical protein
LHDRPGADVDVALIDTTLIPRMTPSLVLLEHRGWSVRLIARRLRRIGVGRYVAAVAAGSPAECRAALERGEIDFLVTADFAVLHDDLISKMIAGVKVDVSLTVRTTYDGGEVESYTYREVKATFEDSVSRGETVKCTCNWSTGQPRIRTT